jgi:hypothetical protein
MANLHHTRAKTSPIEHFIGCLLQYRLRQSSRSRSEIKNAAVKVHDDY